MNTKLGVHVIGSGHRNGYGPLVKQAPAVVLSIADYGALKEAKIESDDRTITIYRQNEPFLDGPTNFDQLPLDTPEQFDREARKIWDGLKTDYLKQEKKADGTFWFDYIQPTNELASTDQIHSIRRLVALETKFMDFCEQDNLSFRLAVGGLAGGSPTVEQWITYIVPLIKRAGEGGHIYSRHAYGGGPLTTGSLANPQSVKVTDGVSNEERPFWEAAYLKKRGILTPMVITEAGQNAGYKFYTDHQDQLDEHTSPFMSDFKRLDQLCLQHKNIWGFCIWTLGKFQAHPKANIQKASGDIADYLRQVGGVVRPIYPTINGTFSHSETATLPPISDSEDWVRGYLWDVGVNMNGDYGEVTRTLNFRQGATAKSRVNIIGRLSPSTVVKLNETIEKPLYYYPVLVRKGDIQGL